MQLSKSHIAFAVACFIGGIVLGASFRSCSKGQPEGQTLLIHDTLTIRDTFRIKEHTKPIYITKTDTCWLPAVTEDYSAADSVKVEVPIMQYAYRDTFCTDSSRIEVGVRFHGYHAGIDEIDLNSQFTIEPRTIVKKKGWGQSVILGLGAGYGVTVIDNRVYAAPSVGVHLVYGFGYHW